MFNGYLGSKAQAHCSLLSMNVQCFTLNEQEVVMKGRPEKDLNKFIITLLIKCYVAKF